MAQILACDHSTANAIIGGTLRRDGFAGVVRYVAEGRSNVNITPAEIKDLKANGIPVALVIEHEADWLLHTDSVQDRVLGARQIAQACKVPDGVLYLACDFDATLGGPTSPGSPGDVNMQAIERSLGVAASVLGRENVGFYGSYFAIEHLVQHGWTDIKYWQTAAWSHGLLHPAAVLYQRATSMHVAGVEVDIDVVLHPNWGQRAVPKRTRVPAPAKKVVAVVKKIHPKVIGAGGAGTLAALLEAYLQAHGVQLTPVELAEIPVVLGILGGIFAPNPQA